MDIFTQIIETSNRTNQRTPRLAELFKVNLNFFNYCLGC